MNIRKNKKYLKTDEKIQKAMMSLLERKAFEKILITDIVKEASIDRSTFYEHYQDINQLMITIEKNLVEKIKRIFDYSFDYSIEEFIEYFEFVKENKTSIFLFLKTTMIIRWQKQLIKNIAVFII